MKRAREGAEDTDCACGTQPALCASDIHVCVCPLELYHLQREVGIAPRDCRSTKHLCSCLNAFGVPGCRALMHVCVCDQRVAGGLRNKCNATTHKCSCRRVEAETDFHHEDLVMPCQAETHECLCTTMYECRASVHDCSCDNDYKRGVCLMEENHARGTRLRCGCADGKECKSTTHVCVCEHGLTCRAQAHDCVCDRNPRKCRASEQDHECVCERFTGNCKSGRHKRSRFIARE